MMPTQLQPPELSAKQVASFWSRCRGNDDCWEWTKSRAKDGYGQVWFGQHNYPAHRIAYWLGHGDWPDSKNVCHKCNNPPCCNPSHLFTGTQADNLRDIGERHHSAKLTRHSIQVIRTSQLTDAEMATRFGVSVSTIYDARTRRTWKHVK